MSIKLVLRFLINLITKNRANSLTEKQKLTRELWEPVCRELAIDEPWGGVGLLQVGIKKQCR